MSAQLNTATLPQFTDLVERQFGKVLKDFPRVMETSGLVIVEQMPEGTGQFRRKAEMPDVTRYARRKNEGDKAVQAQVQYGYEKDLQISRIGLDIAITVEERKQNKYPEVKRKLLDLSNVCSNRRELDLQHRLTFATDTSYTNIDGEVVGTTLGDGFALAYTAHTLTGSATTYRNRLAGNAQFSKGSLENMEKLAVEETFDNLGVKVPMEFDIIFCTDDANTNNAIDELLKAISDVTTSNAWTYNVYKGKYKKVSLPLVATTASGGVDSTKAKYWGIASSMNTNMFLDILEAPFLKTPAPGNNGEDFSTEDWKYGARSSYGITIVSGRWIKMSTGDGQA